MFRDEVKCSASATTKLHLFVEHSSFVPFVYFYEPSFFSLFLPFFYDTIGIRADPWSVTSKFAPSKYSTEARLYP